MNWIRFGGVRGFGSKSIQRMRSDCWSNCVFAAILWSWPRCHDPKDHPVLATAIDGRANAIVTGDGDLRADEELRSAMSQYDVALWGVDSLFACIGVE